MVNISDELLKREEPVRENIEEYSQLFDLDPNLVRAVITQESKFVAAAKSPTLAFGYGQFTNIAAKQVQQIAAMNKAAADLKNFEKSEASDPERGIKAICATLWWLFNAKYKYVEDKKVRLEAVLTFYNAGGKAGALVVKNSGHAKALPEIKALSPAYRSQADKYAPEVLAWYIAWHDKMERLLKTKPPEEPKVENLNPFAEDDDPKLDPLYLPLVEALKLLEVNDKRVNFIMHSKGGMTEITLILPGEY